MEPWEQYKPVKEATPPWESYDGTAGVQTTQLDDEILEEQHPDVTLADRLKIKYFSNDPAGAVKYLQEQHPELEVKSNDAGRILIKSPGATQYRVLDPEGFQGPYEFSKDILDVGWDVPAMALETAATAAGGIAGGLATAPTGPGAIPGALGGAVVAGGLASGGIEAARQGIGKYLGVGGIDPTMLGVSAATGGASPLLFGTGGRALKYAAKKGLSSEAAQQLARAQRGAIGHAWAGTEALRDLGAEALSGIDRGVLKWARKPGNIQKAEEVAAMPDVEMVGRLNELKEEVADKMMAVKQEAGAKIEDIAVNSEALVNVRPGIEALKKNIDDYTRLLDKDGGNTEFNRASLEEAQSALAPFIHTTDTGASATMLEAPAEVAWRLKQTLSNLGKVEKAGLLTPVGPKSKAVASKATIGSTRKAAKSINDQLKKELGKVFEDNSKAYSVATTLEESAGKMLKDPYAGVRGITSPRKKSARVDAGAIDEMLETDIRETADLLKASEQIGFPGLLAKSSDSVTATLRGGAAAGLGTAAGYMAMSNLFSGEGGGYLGGLLGAGAGLALGGPRAMKQYYKFGQGLGKVKDIGPVSIPNTAAKSAWMGLRQGDRP